jgi:hypothetical protein
MTYGDSGLYCEGGCVEDGDTIITTVADIGYCSVRAYYYVSGRIPDQHCSE